MSRLSPLFATLDKMNGDQLIIGPGQVPQLLRGSATTAIGQTALSANAVLALAGEVLSQADLNDLPVSRPRVVRQEHNGVTYIFQVSRSAKGIELIIRPAMRAPAAQPAQAPQPEPPPRKSMRPKTRKSMRSLRAPAIPEVHVPAASPPVPAVAPAAAALASAAAVTIVSAPRAAERVGPKRIDELCREMIERKASDLHLSANTPPVMRIHGEIHFLQERGTLASPEIFSLVSEIMTEKAERDFTELRDADFAHELPGLARFRVNVFEDRNGVGAVLRQIPIEIIPAEQLGLPKACLDFCYLSKGLVVVTGPTGSGKSTTLASMIDYINKNRSDHIITIEDPVEFVHRNIKCLVNQREVGLNTKSFKNALRAALREDPDIVLVGEMRDLETIAIAVETAETGHLVFGTLHTTTAISTIDRLIDQFPTDRQEQIRVMLSESLKGVVAQVLCKKIGGGRVAAQEVLVGTPAVSALIRDGKTFQLASVMQTSKNIGMVTMNDSLFSLVQRRLVEPKEAYIKAVDKSGLLNMFKGAGLPTTFV